LPGNLQNFHVTRRKTSLIHAVYLSFFAARSQHSSGHADSNAPLWNGLGNHRPCPDDAIRAYIGHDHSVAANP
jgi:hypothetical protein